MTDSKRPTVRDEPLHFTHTASLISGTASRLTCELPLLKNSYHQTQAFVSSWQTVNPEDPSVCPQIPPSANVISAACSNRVHVKDHTSVRVALYAKYLHTHTLQDHEHKHTCTHTKDCRDNTQSTKERSDCFEPIASPHPQPVI